MTLPWNTHGSLEQGRSFQIWQDTIEWQSYREFEYFLVAPNVLRMNRVSVRIALF